MGLHTFQQLIETQFPGACVSVDLLRIASTVASSYQGRVALSLVVDAECCLDRLYGGYVSGSHSFLAMYPDLVLMYVLQTGCVEVNGIGCFSSWPHWSRHYMPTTFT